MFADLALLFGGLLILLLAADLLVRGAVELAALVRVPAIVTSLTIVSFGAAAPEMAMTWRAAQTAQGEFGLGVVAGSTIANIFLVLGVAAIIRPVAVDAKGLPPHALFLLAAVICFAGLAYAVGSLGLMSGSLLLAAIVAYLALMARQKRIAGRDPALRDRDLYADHRRPGLRSVLYTIVGFIGLPIGAAVVVDHAGAVAAVAGVRPEIISLSIVAVAAAMPELATVAVAARLGRTDVAVGAVVGSSVFNILAAGGLLGVAGGGAFSAAARLFETPMMLLGAGLIAFFVLTRTPIRRIAGILMTVLFIAFVIALWTSERMS